MPNLAPDTSMTYRDVILRVAEESDYAFYDPSSPDSPADIPQDRQILDKIKRAVNDGIDRLARAMPKCFALRPQFSFDMSPTGQSPFSLLNPLNGQNDGQYYRLPYYINSRPIQGWQWSSQTSNFAGFAQDCDPEQLDRQARTAAISSYPTLASMVPYGPTGDTGDRQTKAVRFYPAPDQNYRITARFLITPPKMVDLSDRHIFGASHDQTVVAFALWSFMEHDAKDPAMRATYEARANRALAESIAIDRENAQVSLGSMNDPGINQYGYRAINPGVDIVTSSMTSVLLSQ